MERGKRGDLVVFFYYARRFCFVCLFVCFGCSVFADLLLISASTDLSYEDSILWPFAGTCQGKKQQFCEGLKSCFNSWIVCPSLCLSLSCTLSSELQEKVLVRKTRTCALQGLCMEL